MDYTETEVEMQNRFKTFTVLIDKLKRSIRKIKTEEMAEYELKSPHLSFLYYLYSSPPMTSKELAEVCDEVAVMYAGRIVEEGSLWEGSKTPRRNH